MNRPVNYSISFGKLAFFTTLYSDGDPTLDCLLKNYNLLKRSIGDVELYTFKSKKESIYLKEVIEADARSLETILKKISGAIGGNTRWKKEKEVERLRTLYNVIRSIYVMKKYDLFNQYLNLLIEYEEKRKMIINSIIEKIYKLKEDKLKKPENILLNIGNHSYLVTVYSVKGKITLSYEEVVKCLYSNNDFAEIQSLVPSPSGLYLIKYGNRLLYIDENGRIRGEVDNIKIINVNGVLANN